MSHCFRRPARFAVGATLAACTALSCGKPAPVAPAQPAAAAPSPPLEPPSVLPLAPVPPILVQAVGLESPESALHDPTSDLYLVSNIAGGPLDLDGNGFISRITPEGALAELKWIDGKSAGVVLNAPKGMALVGDKLFVTDIDTVRSFDRLTGKPVANVVIASATFLNDLTVAPDGTLFVSDTGLRKVQGVADPEKSGSDAIYMLDVQGHWSALIKGPELGGPKGLLADADGVWVANADGEIYRVSRAGQRTAVATLPGGGLDGLVRTVSGRLIVSSRQTASIYAGKTSAAAANTFDPLITELEAPADLGYDEKRRQLIVPLFQQNAIYMQQISAD